MPLRPGRSGHTGGRGPVGGAGEEQRAIAPPTQARETAELPGPSPALQSPLQAAWVLGGIGGRPGRSGEAGRRDPPDWRSKRGEKGIFPAHWSPGSLLGSQGRSPAL